MDSVCLFRPGAGKKRLLWEITRACNQSCPHCYVPAAKANELPLRTIKSIASSLPKFGINDVILSGGEPLLRRDIYGVIAHIRALGLGLDMCTNGTLVSRGDARELCGYLTEISVSFDGYDDASYCRMRRSTPGGFGSALAAIGHLSSFGCEVHVITVATQENFDHLAEIVRLTQDAGAESITVLGLLNPEPGMSMSEDQRSVVQQTVARLRCEYEGRYRINTKRIFETPPFLECRAGIDVFGIDALGSLLPCILFGGKSLWETSDPQSYTLSSKRLAAARREIQEFVPRDCPLSPACGKGCLGSHWVRDRAIGCDTLCKLDHAQPAAPERLYWFDDRAR